MNTLKYLEIPKDRLTQNIQSYLSNTSTRPEPQPLSDFLLLQYLAQPDIEKKLCLLGTESDTGLSKLMSSENIHF